MSVMWVKNYLDLKGFIVFTLLALLLYFVYIFYFVSIEYFTLRELIATLFERENQAYYPILSDLSMVFLVMGIYAVRIEWNEQGEKYMNHLPISTIKIFISKFLFLWVFANGVYLSIFAITFLSSWLNPDALANADDSVFSDYFIRIVIDSYLQLNVELVVFIAFGLLLAHFSWVVWLVVAMVFIIMLVFDQHAIAYLGNPLKLMLLESHGHQLFIPTYLNIAQLLGASVLMLIAYHLYSKRSLAGRNQNQLQSDLKLITLMGLAVIAISSVATLILTQPSKKMATLDHFILSAPVDEFDSLLDEQPAMVKAYEQARQYFEADVRQPIFLQLKDQSAHLGTAQWMQINLNTTALYNQFDEVIFHELVHVFIDDISNNIASEFFNNTRFFHEGLAQYLTAEYLKTEVREINYRDISVAATLGLISFETLSNNDALSNYWDSNLAYHLGEIFIKALVLEYGEKAPLSIIRAMGQFEKSKLSAKHFWWQVFQRAGFNLKQVVDRYDVLVAEIQAEFGDYQLPENIFYRIDYKDRLIRISPTEAAPTDWRYILQWSLDAQKINPSFERFDASVNAFELSIASRFGRPLYFQIGLQHENGASYYGRWQKVLAGQY